MVNIIITIKLLAILIYFVVKIFLWVLVNHKNYSLKHFNNEIIPDKNFPGYGVVLMDPSMSDIL